MEKLRKSSFTTFSLFHNVELKLNVESVCGNSVEPKFGISVEIMWNISDHNKTY